MKATYMLILLGCLTVENIARSQTLNTKQLRIPLVSFRRSEVNLARQLTSGIAQNVNTFNTQKRIQQANPNNAELSQLVSQVYTEGYNVGNQQGILQGFEEGKKQLINQIGSTNRRPVVTSSVTQNQFSSLLSGSSSPQYSSLLGLSGGVGGVGTTTGFQSNKVLSSQFSSSLGQGPGQVGSSLVPGRGQVASSLGLSTSQVGSSLGIGTGQVGSSIGLGTGQAGSSQGLSTRPVVFSSEQGSGQVGFSQGIGTGQVGSSLGQGTGQSGSSQWLGTGQVGSSLGQGTGQVDSSLGQGKGQFASSLGLGVNQLGSSGKLTGGLGAGSSSSLNMGNSINNNVLNSAGVKVTVVDNIKDGPYVDGSYYYRFETSDGTFREEGGVPNGLCRGAMLAVRGSYRYITPGGVVVHHEYISDKNGYTAFPAGSRPDIFSPPERKLSPPVLPPGGLQPCDANN